MKFLPFSTIRTRILVIAFFILTFGIGYRLGEYRTSKSQSGVQVVVNQAAPSTINVNFSLFWDVWQRLNRSYIDKTSLDAQKMVWGAISGMVNSLNDPYTLFLPPKENTEFKQDLGGQFEGIGAQLDTKDGHIIIVAPLKGMPAEKAGVKAGDYVVKVDDVETTGWTVAQAVAKIRGPRGTTVMLTLFRENEAKPLEISIVRNTITVSSVDSWVKSVSQVTEISGISSIQSFENNGKVAYIRLSRFGDRTNDEWTAAVKDLSSQYASSKDIKGFILDLRNNPGGYLESSVFIASEFIKTGIVVSQKNSDGSVQEYPVERKGLLLDIPMVVLINKGSASAAEIVAGALRDYKRATLVGETSFGKGSVQTPEDLPDGAGLHITTGKWLLPKGDSINKTGVTPDVLVPMDTLTASTDAQLAKAIEILLK